MLLLLHSDKINDERKVIRFNGECKVKRDEFHNARKKKYASSKTSENKILLNTRAKEYRLVLNANYKKYTEFFLGELQSLSKTNTKAFKCR